MKTVLLFKEFTTHYDQIIRNGGFIPTFLPVLEFEYINLNELYEKLCQPKYSGLVLTSPRAATACATLFPEGLPSWNDRPVYVVGKATESIVFNQLHIQTKGSHTGNAENLANFIINQHTNCLTPLLFPCGNLTKDVLMCKLQSVKIPVEYITVYETMTKKSLLEDLTNFHLNKFSNILIFFSPSGVDSVIPILQNLMYDFNKSSIIAIGPSTEAQIKKWNLPLYTTVAAPTAESIIELLSKNF